MTALRKFFGVNNPTVHPYKRAVEGLVNPALVVGFELETEECGRLPSSFASKADSMNIGVERDGSLRGNAYEFISRPMQSQHALAAIGDFIEWAGFTEENYSDRCSVHVHVNCTDMEMEQISNVALLYTIAEEILFEYVGGHRDSNIYCIPWSQCRSHFDLIQNFLTRPDFQLKKWNKYTALNLLPLSSIGTIEFRQMHGTADMEKITRWVNIIGAMFKWAKEVELKDLIGEIKTLNTTSQYETFFNRLVGSQLVYNDTYRAKLEAGVISAKYSLISANRPKNSKASDTVTLDELIPEVQAAPRARDANEELRVAIQRLGEGEIRRGATRAQAQPAARVPNGLLGQVMAGNAATVRMDTQAVPRPAMTAEAVAEGMRHVINRRVTTDALGRSIYTDFVHPAPRAEWGPVPITAHDPEADEEN